MPNEQTDSISSIQTRRVTWQTPRSNPNVSILVDLNDGKTVARIMATADNHVYAEMLDGSRDNSTHGDRDGAIRWVMERI